MLQLQIDELRQQGESVDRVNSYEQASQLVAQLRDSRMEWKSYLEAIVGYLPQATKIITIDYGNESKFLSPLWSDRMDAKAEVKWLTQMLETAGTQYTIEHVTDEQLNELLTQVSVINSDSATIVSFSDLAAKSRAPLAYITQQKDEEGENNEGGTDAQNGLKTSAFEILIVGHLENLLTYMDNLKHDDRRTGACRFWSGGHLFLFILHAK